MYEQRRNKYAVLAKIKKKKKIWRNLLNWDTKIPRKQANCLFHTWTVAEHLIACYLIPTFPVMVHVKSHFKLVKV